MKTRIGKRWVVFFRLVSLAKKLANMRSAFDPKNPDIELDTKCHGRQQRYVRHVSSAFRLMVLAGRPFVA